VDRTGAVATGVRRPRAAWRVSTLAADDR
jgi:hypothetical protein